MRRLVPFIAVLALLAAVGCGADDEPSRETRTIVAAFYPLAWAAEEIAGDRAEIVNLTPPGVEPHDLELSPRDVERVRDADLVLYVGGGFMPALEDAVAGRSGPSLDVLGNASDVHVWLDGTSFAAVARSIGRALGEPGSADRLVRRLVQLDLEFRAGLEECDQREIVTTHAAFGLFAAAYGLEQISLTGTSPEAEPGPRQLERLVQRVRASGATTVFFEPLVSPRLAETVAREAGVRIASLNPLEGLTEDELAAGHDYTSVMRLNLATLREALGCR